ncbi:MAG: hypothetical protein Q7N50_00215 [Armatimonadota bacterium]|nr:hypothetical protein [Armatimonadota bacterium]
MSQENQQLPTINKQPVFAFSRGREAENKKVTKTNYLHAQLEREIVSQEAQIYP